MIRQESLAGEGVVEVCAASAPELCAVIAAEFRKFEANLNGSMASVRNTIAATNEANAVKMFQQGEAIEATGLAASPSEQLKKAKQQNEDVCDQVEGMG